MDTLQTPIHTSYYSTLSVPPTATPSEIKRAYTRLALTFHPDKSQRLRSSSPLPRSDPHFQEILTAYTVLSTPTLRRAYDMHGQTGVAALQSSLKSTALTTSPPTTLPAVDKAVTRALLRTHMAETARIVKTTNHCVVHVVPWRGRRAATKSALQCLTSFPLTSGLTGSWGARVASDYGLGAGDAWLGLGGSVGRGTELSARVHSGGEGGPKLVMGTSRVFSPSSGGQAQVDFETRGGGGVTLQGHRKVGRKGRVDGTVAG